MATFAEILADVYIITNRPDLVAETKLAVKVATLKIHQSDFYVKDLYETGASFSTSAYIQQIDYGTLITNWRAFKYLRKYDSVTSTPGMFFKLETPESILDSYSAAKEDICYLAGSVLQIRSSTQEQYMILGCYINPDVNEATYSSWVARETPYAIVFEAARIVFKQIGFDEQSSEMQKLSMEHIIELRQANITGAGE